MEGKNQGKLSVSGRDRPREVEGAPNPESLSLGTVEHQVKPAELDKDQQGRNGRVLNGQFTPGPTPRNYGQRRGGRGGRGGGRGGAAAAAAAAGFAKGKHHSGDHSGPTDDLDRRDGSFEVASLPAKARTVDKDPDAAALDGIGFGRGKVLHHYLHSSSSSSFYLLAYFVSVRG